jgi:putative phosphonate metabolism protein
MSLPRYALYFTPPPESDLARLGAAMLGYDCYAGAAVEQPLLPEITPDELHSGSAEPRRYGFHGTLKAPFTLRDGCSLDEFKNAVHRFAAEWPAFDVGTVSPRQLGRFIALTPDELSSGLSLFAAECVATFDRFRAPLSARDRQRRATHHLSPRQQALLERWGYPYVFDQFRFHMTLTGSLPEERIGPWLECLHRYVGTRSLVIDALTLLEQAGPDAQFRVIGRYDLEGQR